MTSTRALGLVGFSTVSKVLAELSSPLAGLACLSSAQLSLHSAHGGNPHAQKTRAIAWDMYNCLLTPVYEAEDQNFALSLQLLSKMEALTYVDGIEVSVGIGWLQVVLTFYQVEL